MESQNMKKPKRLNGILSIVANRYKDANIRRKLNIALITALLIPLVFSFVYAIIFFNKIQEEATNKNDSDLSLAQLLYKNKVFYEQIVANFSNDKALGLLLKPIKSQQI